MNKRLRNKIVFITGASSGIGEACALQCATEGANLILAARRLERLQVLSERIQNEFSVAVHVLKLDITDAGSAQQAIKKLPSGWENIDVLINSAGLALGLDPLQKGSQEDWDIMIDTNLKGLLSMTQAVLSNMVARNQGHIINLGSIAGQETYQGGVVYCATKHAVRALSEGLRKDLLETNIRVTLISPGMVETELSEIRFKGNKARAKAVYEGLIPLNAHDIAETILFCITRKPHINISEITIFPTDQASASLIHRKK